jgi:vancomycin resistance protein YoaR
MGLGPLLFVCVAVVAATPAVAQDRLAYKVLATSKTSTMEKEMKDAGATGYRFVAVMGGETAMAGNEVVVLMERRNDDRTKYEYRLLATNKTSTLQKELQDAADAGYVAVGQTVFESMFGGQETAAILERDPERPRTERYEFKLIATSKTSTLQKELQEAAELGYEAVAMTVGKTAFGGAELVVITRRRAK